MRRITDRSQLKLRQFEFDAAKFKELIVYIAAKSVDDPTFGAIKLNKILFYADFAAYRLHGAPITGATYRRLNQGPAPKELVEARAELIRDGRLEYEERPYFTYVQKRLVPRNGYLAVPEAFSPEERELIDGVIKFFWGKSAREVSEYSHHEPGWMFTDDREAIPYQTVWLNSGPIDQETEEFARKVGMEYLKSRAQA